MAQSRPTTVYAYLDADGCIYSSRYYDLFILLAQHFRQDIEWLQLGAESTHTRKSSAYLEQKKKLLQRIGDVIESVDLAQLSANSETVFLSVLQHYAKYLVLEKANPRLKLLQFIKSQLRSLGYWEAISAAVVAKANQAMYDYLDGMCEFYSVTKATLGIASHRSDLMNDFVNARNNASGYFIKDIFQLKSQMEIQDEAVDWTVTPFLMADLYHDLPVGTAAQQMLINLTKQTAATAHNQPAARYFYDKHKLSMYYAQVHYTASRHPNKHCVVLVLDDSIDILEAISAKISEASTNEDDVLCTPLFPKNVTFVWQHYTGEVNRQKWVVRGNGPIDHRYRENILLMAKMCGHDPAQVKSTGYDQSCTAYDAATQLDIVQFLQNRRLSDTISSPLFFTSKKEIWDFSTREEDKNHDDSISKKLTPSK